MSKFDQIYNATLNEVAPVIAAAAPIVGRALVGQAVGSAIGSLAKKNEPNNGVNAYNAKEGNTNQQVQIDPKIIQELIAAQNEQQVQTALQKMQATQQKTGTTQQPAV